MVGIIQLLLINMGVSATLLLVLLLILFKRPIISVSEERVYLSKDMCKIKNNVNDSEEII